MDIINIFDDIDDNELFDLFGDRTYVIRERRDHTTWSDDEFFKRFRLKRNTVNEILQQIEQQIRHRTNRNHALTPLQQLLLTLRYYATGSFYIVQGDFIGVHKATVGKVVAKVSRAIANLCNQYVTMPHTEMDKRRVQLDFYNISRFPRVIGALDGTLIKIQSPGGPNAEQYRCRKGYFAINVQGMCDANYKFTNIVARWPGSTHDSTIFNNSNVRFEFERGDYGDALILGDAGYPVKTYLMTPLGNPHTEAEQLYNEAHIRTRNVIERTFGIWKRRFPIVGLGMRCHVPLAQQIIVACAVLHNIARDEAEEPPAEDEVQVLIEEPDNVPIQNALGNINDRIRRQMIDYFGNL